MEIKKFSIFCLNFIIKLFVRADTYQYQLQALWQKAWATGQGVMQNLRFRERGPFKTWRPETMAEAIMAVLREGLSLSQVIIQILFFLLLCCFFKFFFFFNTYWGGGKGGGNRLLL